MEMGNTSFDSLAANGIINFDADAYIRGTTPRYVGNPNMGNGLPFEQPLNAMPSFPPLGSQLPHQPIKDEFSHEKHEKKEKDWKELLTLGVIGGTAVYAGIKYKNSIKKMFSKKVKTPPPSATAGATTAATAATTATTATTAGKSAARKAKIQAFFKNKTVKIAGLVGVGLIALYGLYDIISKKKAHAGAGEGLPIPIHAQAHQEAPAPEAFAPQHKE